MRSKSVQFGIVWKSGVEVEVGVCISVLDKVWYVLGGVICYVSF